MVQMLKAALAGLGGSIILLLFVQRLVLYPPPDPWLWTIQAAAIAWVGLALALLVVVLWRGGDKL